MNIIPIKQYFRNSIVRLVLLSLFVIAGCSTDSFEELEQPPSSMEITYPQSGFSTSGEIVISAKIISFFSVDSTNYYIEGIFDTTFTRARSSFTWDFSNQSIYTEGSSYTLVATWWRLEESFTDTSSFTIIEEKSTQYTSVNKTELYNIAPSWSIDESYMIIQTQRTGNMEIFSITQGQSGGDDDLSKISGSSLFTEGNVTMNSGPDLTPSVSREREEIVFVGNRDTTNDVWTFDLNDSSFTRITEDTIRELFPVWSPDGDKLLFERDSDDGSGTNIWIYNSGTGLSSLLFDHGSFDGHPVFSNDGADVIYHSDAEGHLDIWSTPLNGESLSRLTDWESNEKNPAWSPTGEHFAFTSDRAGNWDIWLYTASSGSFTQLTNNAAAEDFAAFSHDGTKIAFASNRSDNWDIYIIKLP